LFRTAEEYLNLGTRFTEILVPKQAYLIFSPLQPSLRQGPDLKIVRLGSGHRDSQS
jgi:hypothetical protein